MGRRNFPYERASTIYKLAWINLDDIGQSRTWDFQVLKHKDLG